MSAAIKLTIKIKSNAINKKKYLSNYIILCKLSSYANINSSVPNIEKEIELYSKKKQTSVSLKSLMESGQGLHLDKSTIGFHSDTKVNEKILIQVACFLHRELPVRLAHRAVKLEASEMFMKCSKYFLLLLFLTNILYILY